MLVITNESITYVELASALEQGGVPLDMPFTGDIKADYIAYSSFDPLAQALVKEYIDKLKPINEHLEPEWRHPTTEHYSAALVPLDYYFGKPEYSIGATILQSIKTLALIAMQPSHFEPLQERLMKVSATIYRQMRLAYSHAVDTQHNQFDALKIALSKLFSSFCEDKFVDDAKQAWSFLLSVVLNDQPKLANYLSRLDSLTDFLARLAFLETLSSALKKPQNRGSGAF